MGNQIVTPSMGNWYHRAIKSMGLTLKSYTESGTFFMTLECTDDANMHSPVIVKAYEYSSPLDKLSVVSYCRDYFDTLEKNDAASCGIMSYRDVYVSRNIVCLSRDKFEFTLSQRMYEYPALEDIEKQWIAYKMISAISGLHAMGLIHGALNPDNVFVTWQLDVVVGDPAPFKPSHIRSDMPHLFHHFFATASRGHCYLAPEQLLSPTRGTDGMQFMNGSQAMDLFSVGCVLYYLYTGRDLFTFLELAMYHNGTLSIDHRIEEVPEYIRPLIVELVSADPYRRTNIVTGFGQHFPRSFGQISDQFIQFFHGEMNLKHLLRLIPAFFLIMDSAAREIRLLFINAVCHFLVNGDNVQDIVEFAGLVTDFSNPLSDVVKLNRVLPYFCTLLDYPNGFIRSRSVACIRELITTVEVLPSGFESLFSAYLIPYIIRSGVRADVHYRAAMAYNCPLLAFEIQRLAPTLVNETAGMLDFVMTDEDAHVFASFGQAMSEIAKSGCHEVGIAGNFVMNQVCSSMILADGRSDMRNSPSLLSCHALSTVMQSGNSHSVGRDLPIDNVFEKEKKILPKRHCPYTDFVYFLPHLKTGLSKSDAGSKAIVLTILQLFFENASLSDKRSYRRMFVEIVPTVLRYLADDRSSATVVNYVIFLHWCLHRKLVHRSCMNRILYVIADWWQLKSTSVRFHCARLLELIPNGLNLEMLPLFAVQMLMQSTPIARKKVNIRANSLTYGSLNPLMEIRDVALNPKFLLSQRLTRDEILIIAPHQRDDIIAAVADSGGSIYSVGADFTVEKIVDGLLPATAMTEMGQTCRSIMADTDNRLVTIDLARCEARVMPTQLDSRIVSLMPHDDDVVYCFSEGAKLCTFDSRTGKIVNSIQFALGLTGLSSCSWRNSLAIGVGFAEGAVVVVDTRMMFPLNVMKTERPNHLIAVARNVCNFMVASPTSVSSFDSYIGSMEMQISIPNAIITPFEGHAVLTTNELTCFVNCDNLDVNTVLFDDKRIEQVDSGQSIENAARSLYHSARSLTKHSYPVTSVAHSRGRFMSGDTSGFLNFWEIAK